MKVFDGRREITLGSKLGSGANGTVYRVEGEGNICVKVFEPENRNALQRILPRLSILSERFGSLDRDATIPKFFVSDTTNGTPIGYGMLVVEGKEVHNLYGVSSRQVHFPYADFRFLVAVAKNAAIAADKLHRNGIVIGDISGRNLLVRGDATTCWIDTDSFVIGSPGHEQICRDATLGWIPPELQENRYLHTPRLPAHDRFGLAVLIFHILMLGRHPFQGRYTGQGEVPELEANVSNRWYAHAGFNAIPLAPPIGTPPVNHLGSRVMELFSKAFVADTPDRRPHAAEWGEALKILESKFRRCSRYSGHFFASTASNCPWCQVLPDYGNIDPFPSKATAFGTGANAPSYTTALGAEISGFIGLLAVPSNIANSVYRPASKPARPTWSYQPPGWFASLFTPKSSEMRNLKRTKSNFERQANSLQAELTQNLKKQQDWLNILAGCSRRFGDLQTEARRKINEPSLKQSAREQLEAPILNQQRSIYLARFRIEPGQISGFGTKRVAELAGHGIVTAADVTDYRIYRIPGFGASLTAEIVAWRRSKERNFRPTATVIPASEIDKSAREILAGLKPEFQKKREALMRETARLLKDVESCASEVNGIQNRIDVLSANIGAVETAIRTLK